MENIIIRINKKTRMVNLSKTTIGNDGETLQSKFIFEFEDEFVNGQARLEYVINGEIKYVFLDKENETYTTSVKSFLTKKGTIDMQLVILEGTDEENVPIFKSNMFYVYCNSSINAEVEEPEVSSDWFEMANTKLNQADNLNVYAFKNQSTTTINVTSKDGTTEQTQIYDGENGKDGKDGADGITPTIGANGNWFLGSQDTGMPSRGETGDKGDAGSVRFVIVNELPTTNIDLSAIYLKPSNNPDEQNKYGEYIYVNGAWESLSSTSIEVNLDDYVKNTDYASTNKAGVVKISTSMGLKMNEDGSLYYLNANASETQAKETTKRVLTPKYVDYIVKYGLTDNQLDWTDEDKQKARTLLGVDDAIANSVTEVLGGSF